METIDTNNDEINDLETKEFVKKKNKYIFENQIKNKKVNKKM